MKPLFNPDRANAEGWGIQTASDGTIKIIALAGRYVNERPVAPPVFTDDGQAVAWVRQMADVDPYHALAMHLCTPADSADSAAQATPKETSAFFIRCHCTVCNGKGRSVDSDGIDGACEHCDGREGDRSLESGFSEVMEKLEQLDGMSFMDSLEEVAEDLVRLLHQNPQVLPVLKIALKSALAVVNMYRDAESQLASEVAGDLSDAGIVAK